MPVISYIYVPLHYPTVLYIEVQKKNKKQSATGIPYVTAKYVPDTNMHLKCHIYQLLHVQMSDTSAHLCHTAPLL